MLRSLLRSLSSRNFRLFFIGQGISLTGTWMQQVAMSWLVYGLTGSSFQLSLVLFCGQIPSLFLSPFAGALIDRLNRRRVLLWTQSLAMVQAFALAALTLSGQVAVWQIWPLSLFLGIVTTFDITARQAFLSQMVPDRSHLANAIALNSSLMNAARLLGPSLAGLVLAATSPSACFLLNGVSYIAVLWALISMRLPPHERKKTGETSLLKGMREGFRYAFGFVPIRVILLLLTISSMAGSAYGVLLPELSVRFLHGDAATLGLLSSAAGAGALSAAIFLASRGSVVGLGRWIGIGLGLMGLGLISFCQVTQLWQAMLALLVTGFGMMVQMASSNTLLQTIVDEDKRARVMSFYTMAFLGMAPVGSLLSGALATSLGLRAAFVLNGSACLLAAAAFVSQMTKLRRLIHPIYVRLKLLPALTEGIEATGELRLATRE